MLMQRVTAICAKDSNQPSTANAELRAALLRRKSLLDFRLADIADAKRTLGMDSVHARKLDGLVDGWRQVEAATNAQLAGLDAGGAGGTRPCPTGTRPTGNAQNKNNCDQLSAVADQMIGLVKLAFEWDLTRVVALTMSGASSGHRWPSQKVDNAHHTLEHSNDVAGQNVMGTYFSSKFALLLSSLKAIDDGDGKTALYNSSVMLGMECWSDSSNGHYLKNIPFLFAGQGAGKFTTGRIVAASGRNNNDLLVSIQNAVGDRLDHLRVGQPVQGRRSSSAEVQPQLQRDREPRALQRVGFDAAVHQTAHGQRHHTAAQLQGHLPAALPGRKGSPQAQLGPAPPGRQAPSLHDRTRRRVARSGATHPKRAPAPPSRRTRPAEVPDEKVRRHRQRPR